MGWTVNALPIPPRTTCQSLIRPVFLSHQFYQSLQFGTIISEPWGARVSQTWQMLEQELLQEGTDVSSSSHHNQDFVCSALFETWTQIINFCRKDRLTSLSVLCTARQCILKCLNREYCNKSSFDLFFAFWKA